MKTTGTSCCWGCINNFELSNKKWIRVNSCVWILLSLGFRSQKERLPKKIPTLFLSTKAQHRRHHRSQTTEHRHQHQGWWSKRMRMLEKMSYFLSTLPRRVGKSRLKESMLVPWLLLHLTIVWIRVKVMQKCMITDDRMITQIISTLIICESRTSSLEQHSSLVTSTQEANSWLIICLSHSTVLK